MKRPRIEIHKTAEGFVSLQRVRLDDGRYITRKQSISDPVALTHAKPEEKWLMGNGLEILVRDMGTDHILNAMKGIYTREYDRLRKSGFPGTNIIDPEKNTNTHVRNQVVKLCKESRPVYKTMADEVKRRLTPQPLPAVKPSNRKLNLE